MTSRNSTRRIAIIGAGFSGLSLAWALKKQGLAVEIFEKKSRVGGLISTEKSTILVESAANAILANRYVEEMFADIGVQVVESGHRSKKRWIFREGEPRRLPLQWLEVIGAAKGLIMAQQRHRFIPGTGETLAQWGSRCLSPAAVNYLISPAVQGVYGTTAENLSAELIVGPMLQKTAKLPRGQLRGSISAKGGMQEVTDKLGQWLQSQGVQIHFSQDVEVKKLQSEFAAVIVATSHIQAVPLLDQVAPAAAAALKKVPAISLSTCVLGFKSSPLRGFGCLFPREEGFRALGVLFNTDIFPGRGRGRSESWIFGGDVTSDDDVVAWALADRQRMCGLTEAPRMQRVHRHLKALPLYGFELRDFLRSDYLTPERRLKESESPVYLTGNYLGSIGLGKILGQNCSLAQHLNRELS